MGFGLAFSWRGSCLDSRSLSEFESVACTVSEFEEEEQEIALEQLSGALLLSSSFASSSSFNESPLWTFVKFHVCFLVEFSQF